jgi:chemotaxis protein MotB
MSHAPKKKGKKHEEEEHENHERWLVTYADMLTVLMALFIVLFALGQTDKTKFEALAAGMANGLGGPVGILSSSNGIMDKAGTQDPTLDLLTAVKPPLETTIDKAIESAADSDKLKAKQAARAEANRLREIQKQMEAALAAKNMSGAAKFRIDERGLVVSIVTDKVLFQADRAELQAGGRRVLDAVGPVLRKTPNGLVVEGHTNTAKARPKYFPSEWELSSTRASTVVRYLISAEKVQAKRLTAIGYADQRPLYGADNPRANELNRRVEVIVQTGLAADAAALLKGEAKAAAAEEAGHASTTEVADHTSAAEESEH